MNTTKIILIFLSFFILNFTIQSQIVLQLEIKNEVEAVKFYPGSTIKIKTRSFGDEWITKKIDRILLEENIILTEDGMLNLDDISHVQLYNGRAGGVGKLLSVFGGGWLLYGGLASLFSDYKFTWGTAAIGLVSGGVGLFFDKVVSRKKYTIGKNAHLRILDLSYPAPVTPSIEKP